MTKRHCYQCTDLVSYRSGPYFFEKFYSLKKPHYLLHFTIFSQWCPYVTLDISFLSAVPTLGQSCGQCFIVNLWFSHAVFLHAGCWLFLDIKCLRVSLVCSISILLSLTSYCFQLLLAFSHSSMRGLI